MLGDLSRGPKHPSPKKRKPIETGLADEARFIKSWFENPLRAGAVSPSGRFLARMMARYVDPHQTGPVIELGPGTGAITEALLARGVAPDRLYLIEFDPNFCRHLRRRFPGVHVIEGDAYRFRELLAGRFDEAVTAVVSSLPLLVKSEKQRFGLLGDAFDCMAEDGAFIQFTYGVVSPIPRDSAQGPAFRAEPSPPVWLNLPPARVWVYRQGRSLESRGRPNPAQEFFERLRSGAERIQIDLKREFDGARARLSPKARLTEAARKTGRPCAPSSHTGRGGKSLRP
ncbi:Methyltransferase type 12 [Methylocella silvestris BL2]|uniref:Methyltransferase type 12 n=1 Tax=Methylocella silvestris (strain DSM 15510 / CIP 108128 / LMG 27833 / NCIMB 13906 / BL2) TaxID=395965 RepID=B8EIQ1_METSB|nr:rRNA adenine N-6-methyltransferase family protein [Methylocella silvestris]ACK51868.1 Methyltransferase type 12 [Methylocella silvestris BL2]